MLVLGGVGANDAFVAASRRWQMSMAQSGEAPARGWGVLHPKGSAPGVGAAGWSNAISLSIARGAPSSALFVFQVRHADDHGGFAPRGTEPARGKKLTSSSQSSNGVLPASTTKSMPHKRFGLKASVDGVT